MAIYCGNQPCWFDVNLAHLYVVSEGDTRESAEVFGQD